MYSVTDNLFPVPSIFNQENSTSNNDDFTPWKKSFIGGLPNRPMSAVDLSIANPVLFTVPSISTMTETATTIDSPSNAAPWTTVPLVDSALGYRTSKIDLSEYTQMATYSNGITNESLNKAEENGNNITPTKNELICIPQSVVVDPMISGNSNLGLHCENTNSNFIETHEFPKRDPIFDVRVDEESGTVNGISLETQSVKTSMDQTSTHGIHSRQTQSFPHSHSDPQHHHHKGRRCPFLSHSSHLAYNSHPKTNPHSINNYNHSFPFHHHHRVYVPPPVPSTSNVSSTIAGGTILSSPTPNVCPNHFLHSSNPYTLRPFRCHPINLHSNYHSPHHHHRIKSNGESISDRFNYSSGSIMSHDAFIAFGSPVKQEISKRYTIPVQSTFVNGLNTDISNSDGAHPSDPFIHIVVHHRHHVVHHQSDQQQLSTNPSVSQEKLPEQTMISSLLDFINEAKKELHEKPDSVYSILKKLNELIDPKLSSRNTTNPSIPKINSNPNETSPDVANLPQDPEAQHSINGNCSLSPLLSDRLSIASKNLPAYRVLPLSEHGRCGCCYVCDVNAQLKHHRCGCVCVECQCVPTEFIARKRFCRIRNAPKCEESRNSFKGEIGSPTPISTANSIGHDRKGFEEERNEAKEQGVNAKEVDRSHSCMKDIHDEMEGLNLPCPTKPILGTVDTPEDCGQYHSSWDSPCMGSTCPKDVFDEVCCFNELCRDACAVDTDSGCKGSIIVDSGGTSCFNEDLVTACCGSSFYGNSGEKEHESLRKNGNTKKGEIWSNRSSSRFVSPTIDCCHHFRRSSCNFNAIACSDERCLDDSTINTYAMPYVMGWMGYNQKSSNESVQCKKCKSDGVPETTDDKTQLSLKYRDFFGPTLSRKGRFFWDDISRLHPTQTSRQSSSTNQNFIRNLKLRTRSAERLLCAL